MNVQKFSTLRVNGYINVQLGATTQYEQVYVRIVTCTLKSFFWKEWLL